MATTLSAVRTLDANPPAFTTGGQSRLNNPFGISYSSPLVPRQPASYENLESDAWTAPMSAALLEPVSIQTTIEQTLLTANQFLIQTILPLQVTDKIQFSWTKFVFKPYLPNKMPYFSVARFVKGETESREAALVRVGLGFTLEQNFMATRLGQIFYLQHMKQISQAFLEQLQADAIIALLNADMWDKDKLARARSANGRAYVDQAKTVMEREVALWNYMQKTENAWSQLNYWVDSKVGMYTTERLTTWITDHRVVGFRDHVPRDQTNYYIHGPGNQDNIRRGVQYTEVDAQGNTVYCTRGFRIDDRPEFNPLESLQQTGEFYMGIDLPTTDYTIYTTRDRSVSIYNEDLDQMCQISLTQMIDNCQRFWRNGDLLQTNQLPRNPGGDLSDLEQDFLYHTINGVVVPKTFFGQLERRHFNENDKLNLGESVCTALKMNMTSAQIGMMLKELTSCIQVIIDTPVNAEGIRIWRDILNADTSDAPESFRLNAENVLVGDEPGALANLSWPLPLTHATYRGFKEIERQANSPALSVLLRQAFSSTYIDIIQKNMPLFDIYIQTLDNMFPGCALLHPSGAQVTIVKPTMYDVAFENLLRREFPFISFAIGGARELPEGTEANRVYASTRVEDLQAIFRQKGFNPPVLLGEYDVDVGALNYLTTLFVTAVFFVAIYKDQQNRDNTNQFLIEAMTTYAIRSPPLRQKFGIPVLRAFVDSYNDVPELATLSRSIMTTLATSTTRPLVLGPLAAQAVGEGRLDGVSISDQWAKFVRQASTYEDRFNGASTNIESLPLIVKFRANPGLQSPATAAPQPTTASTSGFSSRRPGQVGFNSRRAYAVRDFIPTATSYNSVERITVNPRIDDIDNTLTQAFRDHYLEACRRFRSEPQYLIPVLLFLFTKITKFSVRASADHGFWHPFDYIIARPHMLYSTLSAIKTIPGSATGNTFIGQMTANVANDNQTDETMVHIAGWTGAAVTGENRVFTAPNILVTKYHKGNGVGMISPSEYNPSQGVFGATNDSSIIILAQPRNERYGKCFSLSGELSMTDIFGQSVGVSTSDDKQWTYSSAPFYNRIYGFNQWNWNGRVRGLTTREMVKPNHIVFASLAQYWHQTAHSYSVSTVNTGHWDTKLVGPAKGQQRIGVQSLTNTSLLASSTQANLSCIY